MKRKRRLTERQAWLYLARQWDHPSEDENGEMFISLGIGRNYGLCASLLDMGAELQLIDGNKHQSMLTKIKQAKGKVSYLFPFTAEGAASRAALCRQFAADKPAKKMAHSIPPSPKS